MVQNRIRLFLRHTWLVTFLGTVVLAGLTGLAVYYVTKDTVMKVAAGPEGGINTEFVQALSKKIAKGRDRIDLQLVGTAGPKATEQAIIDHDADLAILPSTIGKSPDWPVVAILRQNVMALIVPAPAAAKAAPGTAANAAAEKAAKPAKKTKSAKPDKKTEKADKTDQTDDDGKLAKVTQLAGRRIGIVNGNEASADLLNVVLGHYGVPLDKVQISQIDPANLAAAVHNDQVDAIFVAGPATGRSITDAVAAATRDGAAPSFIEIDQAEGIARRNLAFDFDRDRRRHLRRQSADAGGQPQDPELPRISGGAEHVQPRRGHDAGARDLFLAARARRRDAGRSQDPGAVDRQGCRRPRASGRARLP